MSKIIARYKGKQVATYKTPRVVLNRTTGRMERPTAPPPEPKYAVLTVLTKDEEGSDVYFGGASGMTFGPSRITPAGTVVGAAFRATRAEAVAWQKKCTERHSQQWPGVEFRKYVVVKTERA